MKNNISFSNICVRPNSKKNWQSILSFGELYSFCIIYYICLKRMLTIHGDCVVSINSILSYINKFYIDISGNIKRQRQYFKSFLSKIIYTGIFTIGQNIDLDNIRSDELISLNYNNESETEYGYSKIDEDEIISILSYKETPINNIKLFNIYCDIVSRIFQPSEDDGRLSSEQYKFCYPTFDTFINDGVIYKKDTIKEYLDILVKLNLIRYDSVGDMYQNDKCITGAYHYILVKDYPNMTEEQYHELFKCILSGYKKVKKDEGWNIAGKKKQKKDKPESKSLQGNKKKKVICSGCGNEVDKVTQGLCNRCCIEISSVCQTCGKPVEAFVEYCSEECENKQSGSNRSFSDELNDFYNSKNPEVDLMKEYIGSYYSEKDEDLIQRIIDGKMTVEWYLKQFTSCTHASYDGFLEFKRSGNKTGDPNKKKDKIPESIVLTNQINKLCSCCKQENALPGQEYCELCQDMIDENEKYEECISF